MPRHVSSQEIQEVCMNFKAMEALPEERVSLMSMRPEVKDPRHLLDAIAVPAQWLGLGA